MKIPELQENMFQLATEMERAGLVEEIVSDGLALSDVRSVLGLFRGFRGMVRVLAHVNVSLLRVCTTVCTKFVWYVARCVARKRIFCRVLSCCEIGSFGSFHGLVSGGF